MDADRLAQRMSQEHDLHNRHLTRGVEYTPMLPYARALIEAEKALAWTIGYFCEASCAWPSAHEPECLRLREALASLRSLLEKGK